MLKRLLQAGLHAADPMVAMRKALSVAGSTLQVGGRRYALKKFEQIVCVGAGKGAGRMAMALEERLGDRLSDGCVVVKDHSGCYTKKIQLLEASHPVPDARSVRAGKNIFTLAHSLTKRDLLFVLVSGGASSLLVAPAPGLTLGDKKRATTLLLRSGATIQEINTVRKHLSAIKGGQLASATSATVISFLFSDVLGDDVTIIGSGPTAPDPTTFRDARDILIRYRIWNQVSSAVRDHLEKGMDEERVDATKSKAAAFSRVQNQVIGNNRLMVQAIVKQAKLEGLHPLVLTTTLEGEAREVGTMISAIAKEIQSSGQPVRRPACLVWGGEPTVTVRGKGLGGRAQELVLSAAMRMAGLSKMYVAGFGSDGSDGPTEMAGAIVDGRTVERAIQKELDPFHALANNDSYSFFNKSGGHIQTGATGTNVNDVYILLAL